MIRNLYRSSDGSISTDIQLGELAKGEYTSQEIVITNKEEVAITLFWTEYSVPEGLITSLYIGSNKIPKDTGQINIGIGQSRTVRYEVFNEDADADTGTSVTVSWSLKFYLLG